MKNEFFLEMPPVSDLYIFWDPIPIPISALSERRNSLAGGEAECCRGRCTSTGGEVQNWTGVRGEDSPETSEQEIGGNPSSTTLLTKLSSWWKKRKNVGLQFYWKSAEDQIEISCFYFIKLFASHKQFIYLNIFENAIKHEKRGPLLHFLTTPSTHLKRICKLLWIHETIWKHN